MTIYKTYNRQLLLLQKTQLRTYDVESIIECLTRIRENSNGIVLGFYGYEICRCDCTACKYESGPYNHIKHHDDQQLFYIDNLEFCCDGKSIYCDIHFLSNDIIDIDNILYFYDNGLIKIAPYLLGRQDDNGHGCTRVSEIISAHLIYDRSF